MKHSGMPMNPQHSVSQSACILSLGAKHMKLISQDSGAAIKLAANVHNLEQGCLKSNDPCKTVIRVAIFEKDFDMLYTI